MTKTKAKIHRNVNKEKGNLSQNGCFELSSLNRIQKYTRWNELLYVCTDPERVQQEQILDVTVIT